MEDTEFPPPPFFLPKSVDVSGHDADSIKRLQDSLEELRDAYFQITDDCWAFGDGSRWLLTDDGLMVDVVNSNTVYSPILLSAGDGDNNLSIVYVQLDETASTDSPGCFPAVPQAHEMSSTSSDAEVKSTGAEIEIDMELDLVASTTQKRNDVEGKACEDRFVGKVQLPIGVISSLTSILTFSSVIDGHGGPECAEYCAKHLHNVAVSVFRQQLGVEKRRRESNKNYRTNTSRELSVEVQTLLFSLKKAFEITNKNFCSIAQKRGLTDGACVVAAGIYGPDTDGSMKIVTAHVGDCRAVLVRKDGVLRLTQDHLPHLPEEMSRIEKAGGVVTRIQSIWRAVKVNEKTGLAAGLAVSRSIGDLPMKLPQNMISSVPDVSCVDVDLEQDLFLILASDGVWEKISDEEAGTLVREKIVEDHADSLRQYRLQWLQKRKEIHNHNASAAEEDEAASSQLEEEWIHDAKLYMKTPLPNKASSILVEKASERGGMDDKTATVIFFGWHRKDFLDKALNAIVSDAKSAEQELTSLDDASLVAMENETTEKDDNDLFPIISDIYDPSDSNMTLAATKNWRKRCVELRDDHDDKVKRSVKTFSLDKSNFGALGCEWEDSDHE